MGAQAPTPRVPDEFEKMLEIAVKTEEKAIRADQEGDIEKAINRYKNSKDDVKAVMEAALPDHGRGYDYPLLQQHKDEIKARRQPLKDVRDESSEQEPLEKHMTPEVLQSMLAKAQEPK